jgi:hypothetical protein
MALLLITATVRPPAAATSLARRDPAERLKDYAVALQFYIRQLEMGVFDGLVFVENSDSEIRELKALGRSSTRSERIEFISYQGLDYPPQHGRAFGELRLLDHAMGTSELIRAATPDEVIWKVTGRYIIRNAERLVSGIPAADLYCHCRDLPRPWVDMYFMGWRKGAYPQTLQGACERVRDGDGAGSEAAFRVLIDEHSRNFRVQKRFPVPPQVSGIRGYDNQAYDQQWVKTWSRRVLAAVAPGIWV